MSSDENSPHAGNDAIEMDEHTNIDDIKNKTEIYIGGAIAFAATICIIWAIARDDFSLDSVLSGVVDFAQVIVLAVFLLVAIKRKLFTYLYPPPPPPETFKDVLEHGLGDWVIRNQPLISYDGELTEKGIRRYSMLTDIEHVFDVGVNPTGDNYKKGRFVELPSFTDFKAGATIKFYLNLSTFSERAKAKNSKASVEAELVAGRISNCLNVKFDDILTASVGKLGEGAAAMINVSLKRDLHTPDDARQIIYLLDYVKPLYMVAA